MSALHCDDLRHVALDAKKTDEAGFLASRPGPYLLVMGPDPTNLKAAVLVPLGTLPSLRTLGRHAQNDIVAPWPSISRRHAVIVAGEDGAFVIDRGSANGTFHGTERLLPDVPRALKDGDELQFGTALRAVYLTNRGLLETVRRINAA